MNKLIFTALFLSIVQFTIGQEDKETFGFENGDAFISGSLSYGDTKNGDSKSTSFNVSPRAGFFVSEKIALGGGISFASNNSVDFEFFDERIERDRNIFSVDVFARNYFTSGRFMPFGELGLSYLSLKNEFNTQEQLQEFKGKGFGIEAGAGINFFLSKNFSLEAFWGALSYTSTKPEERDGAETEASNTLSANLNFSSIRLGLLYKL